MDDPTIHEKELVWVQVLYLYVVPTLLVYYGIIPAGYRVVMLVAIALLLLGIIKRDGWTHADLGIRKKYMKDILPYTLFTIAGISFIIWLARITPQNPFTDWWENMKFLVLFIPVSVLQEIIFRGVLMNMLRRAFTNPLFIIVLNASLFALLHVIFLNSVFVLPLTFIAGVGFAWIYYEYPNLILISAAHTILNFTAMILGFFAIR